MNDTGLYLVAQFDVVGSTFGNVQSEVDNCHQCCVLSGPRSCLSENEMRRWGKDSETDSKESTVMAQAV